MPGMTTSPALSKAFASRPRCLAQVIGCMSPLVRSRRRMDASAATLEPVQ